MTAALTSSITTTTTTAAAAAAAPRLLFRHAKRVAAQRRSLATTTTATPTVTAADAAQQILRSPQGQTTSTRREALDAHQLQRLSLALGRRHLHPGLDVTSAPPPAGTPLPPGYHLAYFTPAAVAEADLADDGTDGGGGGLCVPPPFVRRVWAGGSLRWVPGAPPLRVGDVVEERTRLVGAEAKRSRAAGGEMVLVEVEKEFWGPGGLALVDRRSWIFRPPAAVVRGTEERGKDVGGSTLSGVDSAGGWRRSYVKDVNVRGPDGAGVPERILSWSPVALFRFSALTYNAHMIHYNEGWATGVERHPGLVVHGPLNLICMLDYFRDAVVQHGGGGPVLGISYRALSPLYAGDEYSVRTTAAASSAAARGEGGRAWEVVVARGAEVCMKGTVLTDG